MPDINAEAAQRWLDTGLRLYFEHESDLMLHVWETGLAFRLGVHLDAALHIVAPDGGWSLDADYNRRGAGRDRKALGNLGARWTELRGLVPWMNVHRPRITKTARPDLILHARTFTGPDSDGVVVEVKRRPDPDEPRDFQLLALDIAKLVCFRESPFSYQHAFLLVLGADRASSRAYAIPDLSAGGELLMRPEFSPR